MKTKAAPDEEYEYLIVKRAVRRKGRSFRPRDERPMEPWERAVLDVFSNTEVRRQMLWEAGRVKLDHLKRVMVKANVSNVAEVMDELWLKLAHQSDQAQENRPFAEIDAAREKATTEIRREIDEGYRQMEHSMTALALANKESE